MCSALRESASQKHFLGLVHRVRNYLETMSRNDSESSACQIPVHSTASHMSRYHSNCDNPEIRLAELVSSRMHAYASFIDLIIRTTTQKGLSRLIMNPTIYEVIYNGPVPSAPSQTGMQIIATTLDGWILTLLQDLLASDGTPEVPQRS